MNLLYYGDNLDILRQHVKDASVDLIYLDPPFNSKRDYNLIFKTPKGTASEAQVTAFEDSWRWGEQAEREYDELLHCPNPDVSELLQALRRFLKTSDMMAYLAMMANRLVELHRVLKPTGSLYLHCDPTASHYLKIILDTVFGPENFRNEIIWKRTTTHSDAKRWSPVSDTILFVTKSATFTWNPQHAGHDPAYVASKYRYDDGGGLGSYRLDNMTSPNPRPNMMYEWKGHASPPNGWRYSTETMQKLDSEGRIWYPDSKSKRPQLKRYLDEMPGRIMDNVWTDISPINSQAAERFGYPTQKPLALLERIVQASSNPGDVVLDPFCGCGTAVHAAQKLGRAWIGIDITHLAISLIEKRLRDAFPGITFETHGAPADLAGSADLAMRNKYEFQWWACSLVNAQPFGGKKKGADTGIDGLIYFQDDLKSAGKKIIVSVKGGEHVGRAMIADLKNSVEREGASLGLFVTLTPPTQPMIAEAASAGFYASPHRGDFPKIQILTIAGLLAGHERPAYPDLSMGAASFKKAAVERGDGGQSALFP